MSDAESQEAKDLARYREGEAHFDRVVKDMNFFDHVTKILTELTKTDQKKK